MIVEFQYLISKHKSGIYCISNNLNDKVYIGSSCYLKKRFSSHKFKLENNKHHSCTLQRFYNKYKNNGLVFKFELLEGHNDKSNLIKLEQKWLDCYYSYNRQEGYNICKFAASTLGVKRSRESIEKMKKTWEKNGGHPSLGKESKLKGSRLTEETKKKISIANSGERNGNYRKKYSEEEICKKRKISSCKPVVEINNSGEVINEFISIKEASRVLGLDPSNISRVCNGLYHSYEGRLFRFKNGSIPPKKQTKNKEIIIFLDTEEVFKSKNRREVATFLNISYKYLTSIINKGQYKQYTIFVPKG